MPAHRSTHLLIALVAASPLALAACAAARARLDPGLAASAEEWRVAGANPRRWNAPLAVGPYRTGAVRDAGTIGWSVQIQRLGVESTHRPYAFAVSGPGDAVDVECHERGFQAFHASGVQVDLRSARGRPVLACAFRSGARTWTLSLRATGAAQPAYAGELRDDAGAAFPIRSVHLLEGSPVPLGSPAGYEVEGNGAKIALIEVVGPGRVLVARGAVDGGALGSAAAALLLFQPPDDR